MTLIGHDTGTRIIGSGVKTATPGAAIALDAARCKSVLIQADEDNGDSILCIGDASIDADSDPPRGRMLYATQAERVYCQNANEIYIDATGAAKAHYIIEG